MTIRHIGTDWAIPFDPVRLIAHLRVDKDTAEIQATLRLCHRYGAGPDVHIANLPAELLDNVIHFTLEPRRKEAVEELEKTYRCFAGNCSAHETTSVRKKY